MLSCVLTGRTALVTGAGSGFGAEISRAFAGAGANVIAFDKNQQSVENVSGEISRAGLSALPIVGDVTISSDLERVRNLALDRFGQLDILINNAGVVAHQASIEETSETDFDRMFAVNVKGVFLATRTVLPVLKRQLRGWIVNIASGSALRPRPGASVYSASKGAVIAFTKALALEAAPFGIRANVICPALARTPLLEAFVGEDDPRIWAEFAAQIPLCRLITAKDVALATLWLCSDSASMITGTCLPVDGGRCV
jgi:3-oxoacyl-[acyl-carrier protein] reductase